jgi:uncharacterized protein YdaU (DUF1376 family)
VNYYDHHLGDYMRDTAHLSMLEDGAYRRLIDAYYAREKPLPSDIKECCKLARAFSKAERDAVAYVLKEFFELTDDGYRQKRCDEVIASFYEKKRKAKESADARWSHHRTQCKRNANASETHVQTQCERNANASETHVQKGCESDAPTSQYPITNPKEERAKALAEARAVPGLDIQAFDRFVAYRAERKPAIKTISLKAAAQELAKFGPRQADVVQHSVANGYQGLVPPKNNSAHAAQLEPRRAREFPG